MPTGAEHPRGGLSKGIFRAPARGTFALGGKSTQKRRSNLRFENPFARLHPPRILTAFATRTLCRGNFTEMLHRHFFSFRCRFCSEMQGFTAVSRTLPNRRPKAATYLCRFAAKARFDNRLPRVRFPKGRAAALPFGRFKERGFLRGEGNRNPSPLKWRSLDTFFRQGKKVTRRRHPAPGRGTPRSTQKKHPSGCFFVLLHSQ